MVLLSAENLEKNFGERVLFSELNIALNKGDKAALIAANGTGKTSLLKILAKKDQPENGGVVYSKDLRISILDQDPVFDGDLTLSEQINLSGSRINGIISEYEKALLKNDQQLLNKASAAMDVADAWDYERKLTEILDRFSVKKLDQKISTLSGGQQKRLALALNLLDKPDLLLLDEPTNHLDIDMIEWLEEYLSKSNISFLMVTHDRYFLDNVCNVIFELENGMLYTHNGNYETYLKNKEEREAAFEAEVQKAKSYVRNELDWMRRMPKARTTKSKSRIDNFHEKYHKAHQSREKKDLKLEIRMNRLGGKIMNLKEISKSFDDSLLFKNFSYNFRKGERIGIIGANGTGKSSFLNILAGSLKADRGEVEKGETIVLSYYRQEGIQYEEDKKVIEIVTDIAEYIQTGSGSQLSASQFLQYFMFPPKVQHQAVSSLSGGEKRRLYLLTVLIKNPNFLILDEPTNDLDLITLQKLEDFLLNFGGCLVVTSHDRFLLDKICDSLFIFVGNGIIKTYVGPYSEYRNEKITEENQLKQDKKHREKEKSPVVSRENTQKKKLSFKEKTELEKLEKEIPELEKEKKQLEEKVNSGITDYQKLTKLSARVSEIIELLDEKEERWLELDEKK